MSGKATALGLASLALSVAAAQEKPQQPLTFASTVDVVAVDVSVLNARGQPVTSLGPEDFALKVGGKPRPIVSAQYVPLGGSTDTGASGQPAPPIAEHYSTNEGAAPGRLIVIGVDQGTFPFVGGSSRSAIAAVDRFLDRLTPSDRVALAAFPLPGPSVDFTSDHDKIRAAAKTVAGKAPPLNVHISVQEALAYLDNDRLVWDPVIQRECGLTTDKQRLLCVSDMENQASDYGNALRRSSIDSLRALRGLMGVMARFEEPKTLILITGGLWSETAGEINALATTASLARVTLFVFLLESQATSDASFAGNRMEMLDSDPMFKHVGLYALASQSRGAIFRASGTEDAAFDRMARELSGYYLLGFEPTAEERDGKVHDIAVSIARSGLTVRARRALAIPSRMAARSDEEVLGATLRDPLPETAIPLRVATFNAPDRKSARVKVIVDAEIGGDGEPPADLAVAFVLVDEKGHVAATESRRLAAGPAIARRASYLGSAVVDPGRYTLKLAVLDRHGRKGSVERALNAVRRSAAGLDLGDLMLADTTSLGDGQYRPGVDVDVSAGGVAAYLEVHASDPRRFEQAGVRLEVAQEENGPALLSVPAELGEAGDASARIAQATLSARLLPPGDYIARAVLTMAGARVERASRPFRVSPVTRGGNAREPGPPARGIPVAELAPAVARFTRDAVLRPEVLAPFLDRLATAAPPPRSLAGALKNARDGRLDLALSESKAVRDGSLAASFLRGLGLLAAGEMGPATAEFRESLRIASDFFPAVFYMGVCLAADGQDREAVGAWQTSLIGGRTTSVVHAVLADALMRLNEPAEAVDVLKEAAEAWPDDLDIARRLGVAYAATGALDQAKQLLSRHLDRQPDDQPALFVMMRLVFEGFAANPSGDPFAGDRERLTRYARAYVAAKGPQSELVVFWLKRLEQEHR